MPRDDLLFTARRAVEAFESDDLDASDRAMQALRLVVYREEIRRLTAERDQLAGDVADARLQLDALQLERSQWGAHHDAQAARIAELEAVVTESDAAITRLSRERDEAREELARRPVIHEYTPATPEPAPANRSYTVKSGAFPCGSCDAVFPTAQKRAGHWRHCVARKAQTAEAAAAPAPVRAVAAGATDVLDDNPDWHCADCRRNTFAPALHDPARCITCAAMERQAA
jgi:cell division protein FtsL